MTFVFLVLLLLLLRTDRCAYAIELKVYMGNIRGSCCDASSDSTELHALYQTIVNLLLFVPVGQLGELLERMLLGVAEKLDILRTKFVLKISKRDFVVHLLLNLLMIFIELNLIQTANI